MSKVVMLMANQLAILRHRHLFHSCSTCTFPNAFSWIILAVVMAAASICRNDDDIANQRKDWQGTLAWPARNLPLLWRTMSTDTDDDGEWQAMRRALAQLDLLSAERQSMSSPQRQSSPFECHEKWLTQTEIAFCALHQKKKDVVGKLNEQRQSGKKKATKITENISQECLNYRQTVCSQPKHTLQDSSFFRFEIVKDRLGTVLLKHKWTSRTIRHSNEKRE